MGITLVTTACNPPWVHLPEMAFETHARILGMCNLQDSPARWVADSPQCHPSNTPTTNPIRTRHLASFLWGHMGWVVCPAPRFGPDESLRNATCAICYAFLLPQTRTQGRLLLRLSRSRHCVSLVGGVIDWRSVGGDCVDRVAALPELDGMGGAVRTVLYCTKPCVAQSHSARVRNRNYETRDHSTKQLVSRSDQSRRGCTTITTPPPRPPRTDTNGTSRFCHGA